MRRKIFIGCDVSKDTLDFVVRSSQSVLMQTQIENSQQAIRRFKLQLGDLVSDAILVCEYTGIYTSHLLMEWHNSGMDIALVTGTDVRRAFGTLRGKTDAMDAMRISEYALRFTDKLKCWTPPRKVITQLQHLTVLRDRLIKAQVQLKVPLQEARAFLDPSLVRSMEKYSAKPLAALKTQIAAIEETIDRLISEDAELSQLNARIQSVPGIGKVTATELLIRTNEFKSFTSAKQLACHAGVAPFPYTSGSSIQGKTRVSHKANKRMKTLLHMAAMNAVRNPGELQEYYQRKVHAGKNKMSALNAVRNKLIHRVFAVVRDGVIYQKNYQIKFAVT